MSTKKSTKQLIISTQAANGHGFRTRTAGIDLTDFKNNPLLLWMHKRPTGESTTEVLPLGFWSDIELKGEELSGIPVFDANDAFAMKIFNKVENGTIRMASAGLKPKPNGFREENDELWLWESYLFEASLCDIGSNKEALAVSLYNEDAELVTLNEIYTKPKIDKNMSKIKLTATAARILNLSEGHEMESSEAIGQLVVLADGQKEKIKTLTKDKDDAEKKLADLQAENAVAAKNTLLDTAEKVDRKITADERPFLLKMDLEDLKQYLAKKPANPTVSSKMKDGKNVDETLLKMDWKELHKSGKAMLLKEQDFEAFNEKFKAEFGRDYK